MQDDSDDDDDSDDYDALSDVVHSYSYRPSPNFLGDTYSAESVFLGLELEVPTSYPNELAASIYRGPGAAESVLYCKDDSSIEGVEIVSHPMTHEYFRNSFPFGMFGRASDQSDYLRTLRPSVGYGLHVHVSRAGFKSESHILRFLLLIYGNPFEIETLARRDPSEWASLADVNRCEDKASSSAGAYDGTRYAAVNACNRATLEVRVFRSTWDEQTFRAAVDFVHAAVTYTRHLSPLRATRGGLSWETFRTWVDARPEYARLSAEIDRLFAPGLSDSDDTETED